MITKDTHPRIKETISKAALVYAALQNGLVTQQYAEDKVRELYQELSEESPELFKEFVTYFLE